MTTAAIISTLMTAEEVMKRGNERLKNMRSSTSEERVMPFHCELALSMGKLKGAFKDMDDHLKLIIATTNNYIAQLIKNSNGKIDGVSWDEIVGAMNNNPSIVQIDDEIYRSDKIVKDAWHDFKFDGSPDPQVVREVHTWFTNLIQDEDVLRDLRLNVEDLANVVAWTGATITNIGDIFYKNEKHELDVMEIGILRYPDIDHPYFKLYKVVMKAWSDSHRTLWNQHDKNGIIGTYTMRKFGPRKSVLDRLSKEAVEKGVNELEAMLLNLGS